MAAKRLNPELRAAWFLPKTLPLGDRVVRLARRVTPHKVSGSDRVQVETVSIDHPGRPLTVHVFSPVGRAAHGPHCYGLTVVATSSGHPLKTRAGCATSSRSFRWWW